MRKKGLMIILFIVFCFTTSCVEQKLPNGKKPSQDFTVNEYLTSNAIFEEKDRLTLSGLSEKDVCIKVDLKNSENKIIETYQTTVNDENKWSLSFITPKGSYEKYQLVVYDAHQLYVKVFENIRFGHVWMLAGEDIMNQPIQEESSPKEVVPQDFENLAFYLQTVNEGFWLDVKEDYQQITEISYKYGKKLLSYYNMPIGFILVQEQTSHLEEWLFMESIESRRAIKDYLIANHTYKETPQNFGDAGYIGENKIKNLEGLSLQGILWYQGISELNAFNNEDYINNYFRMLMTMIESWYGTFEGAMFTILQECSLQQEATSKLRYIQNIVANYYSFIKLVPTYDLNEKIMNDENEESLGALDLDQLAIRVVDIVTNNKYVSSYANLLLEVDETLEIVDKVIIEFENTRNLQLIQKDDKELENENICYFHIYYDDEELGIVELEIVPIIKKNTIEIDLRYKVEEIGENNTIAEVEKIYDKSRISIVYGLEGDLTNVNLYNDYHLPILPFRIDID